MVAKGQYLERMTVVPAAGGVLLEALFHRGDLAPPVLLAPPSPLDGGSMDAPVVAEVAWAVTRAGHATLRFNYRGVGASQGSWDEGVHDAGDLASAVEHLVASAPSARVGLCGYGYGALRCTDAAVERTAVTRLALVAPHRAPGLAATVSDLATRPGGPPSVLVVLGAEDGEGRAFAAGEGVAALGEKVCVAYVPHADHRFLRGLPEVGRVVADFFGR